MNLLRIVSLLGIVFSLVAHLISWGTPDLLEFSILGIPLQIISMIMFAKLTNLNIVPFQKKADLRWLHQTASVVHALLFLSVLSFMFHVVMMGLQVTAFPFFLIRVLSSIWITVFAIGYGYTSWTGRYQSKLSKMRGQGFHRHRLSTIAEDAKLELKFQSPPRIINRRS